MPKGRSSVTADYNIRIVVGRSDVDAFHTISYLRVFTNDSSCWGHCQLLQHAEIVANPSAYINGGTLTLFVQAAEEDPLLHDDDDASTTVAASGSSSSTPPSDLANNLGALLGSAAGADVTLCCGGESIAAHACILAARPAVFAALLSKDSAMVLDRSAVSVPAEITPATLRRMLKYIYTDRLVPGSVEEVRRHPPPSRCCSCRSADGRCFAILLLRNIRSSSLKDRSGAGSRRRTASYRP